MSVGELVYKLASHLIEIMGVILVLALITRYLAFRAGKANLLYFTGFTKAVDKELIRRESDKIKQVESWIVDVLDTVLDRLPGRTVREGIVQASQNSANFRHQDKETLEDYTEGKKSIILSIKSNLDILKCAYRPDFVDFSDTVLERDAKWNRVAKIIPVDTFSRLLDIMPGLFIIGGIFGTFIGITAALPQIAQIDLSNLDEAAPVLNNFVGAVAYSMYTSIAGILYSVVMTILNTIFPLATTRDEVRRQMENCLQAIWLRIHGDEMSKGEDKMLIVLQDIHKTLEKSA